MPSKPSKSAVRAMEKGRFLTPSNPPAIRMPLDPKPSKSPGRTMEGAEPLTPPDDAASMLDMDRRIPGSGSVTKTATGKLAIRVTIAPGNRPLVTLPWAKDDRQATARGRLVRDWGRRLRASGHPEHIEAMIEDAAVATTREQIAAIESAVAKCEAAPRAAPPRLATDVPTVAAFGLQWTSGELARRWPDHVRVKKSAGGDAQILRDRINPIIGGKRLDEVTLADADRVMASLPVAQPGEPRGGGRRRKAKGLTPASRRRVAEVLHKLLGYATYPARYIATNPLPRGWLPKPGKRKAMTCLYPDEDRRMLGHRDTPLVLRTLFGFLAREGMREGEALALDWTELDLERGAVRLDTNKTDDPRAWALDPGVARALRRWHALEGKPTSGAVFKVNTSNLVRDLHAAIAAAGLTRPELTERSAVRQPLRVHDLRATFVTVALATGRSEAWVMDRTGHRSSVMLNEYRRQARTWAELDLGALAPLDQAIPELRSRTPKTPAGGQKTGSGGGSHKTRKGRNTDNGQGGRSEGAVRSEHFEAKKACSPHRARTGTSLAGQQVLRRTSPLPSQQKRTLASRSTPASDPFEDNLKAPADPMEEALAGALALATRAGDLEAVSAIVAELRARRLDRAGGGVVDLATARERR